MRPGALRPGLLLSAAAHAAAAAALLLPWGGSGGPVGVPPIEVELIQASAMGADAPAEASPTPPAAGAQQPDVQPAAPPAPSPELPRPVPQAPRPAARQAAPAPVVNLGNGGDALADLSVRSEDVVPPRPDSSFRNLPPAYPASARRRGQTGTVRLVVHVSDGGFPVLVEVAASSGHPSLDQAAVQAVERWRFTPAQGAAGPVPFDYPLDIHFVGNRP